MRINLVLCLLFLFHNHAMAQRKEFISLTLSAGVSSNLYTDERLYQETNGAFNSDLVQDVAIEISGNKINNPNLEGVLAYSIVKHENTALKVKNEKKGFILKFRYFPLDDILLRGVFAAFLAQSYSSSVFTIDSQKEVNQSLRGLGCGLGYDLHMGSNYRVIFEYNYMDFSGFDAKFNSHSNTLRIGIGYML